MTQTTIQQEGHELTTLLARLPERDQLRVEGFILGLDTARKTAGQDNGNHETRSSA